MLKWSSFLYGIECLIMSTNKIHHNCSKQHLYALNSATSLLSALFKSTLSLQRGQTVEDKNGSTFSHISLALRAYKHGTVLRLVPTKGQTRCMACHQKMLECSPQGQRILLKWYIKGREIEPGYLEKAKKLNKNQKAKIERFTPEEYFLIVIKTLYILIKLMLLR